MNRTIKIVTFVSGPWLFLNMILIPLCGTMSFTGAGSRLQSG